MAKLDGANSQEFDENTPHPVIAMLKDQRHIERKGGTMRLGQYACTVAQGSLAHRLYGENLVLERHRHRYEVNPRYHRPLQEAGLKFSGTSPDERLVEMIELADHPYFIASQFHPEFKSRPTRAHPLFRGLVEAAVQRHVQQGKSHDAPPPAPTGRTRDSLAFGSAATGEEESDNEGVLTLTLDDIRQSITREG